MRTVIKVLLLATSLAACGVHGHAGPVHAGGGVSTK